MNHSHMLKSNLGMHYYTTALSVFRLPASKCARLTTDGARGDTSFYPGSGRGERNTLRPVCRSSCSTCQLHRGEYNGGERGTEPKSQRGVYAMRKKTKAGSFA